MFRSATTILAQVEPLLRWQSPWLLPVAAGAGALLAAAVVWLYPAQVRQVGRPWRWLMPALRVAALLALAVSLARPVVLRATSPNDHGPVLVLIDSSKSMSVVDGGR